MGKDSLELSVSVCDLCGHIGYDSRSVWCLWSGGKNPGQFFFLAIFFFRGGLIFFCIYQFFFDYKKKLVYVKKIGIGKKKFTI